MKALWCLTLGVLLLTHCCTFQSEMYSYASRRCYDGHCIENFEIDPAVWERELPPYYDDTIDEGR